MTGRELVEAALAQKPRAVVAQKCKVATRLLGKWLAETAEPDAEQRAVLERLAAVDIGPAALKVHEGGAAEAERLVREAGGAVVDEAAVPDGVQMQERHEPAGAVQDGRSDTGQPITVETTTTTVADPVREEQSRLARDLGDMLASPGWAFLAGQMQAKQRGHAAALLHETKGRVIAGHQAAHEVLAWVLALPGKPAAERAKEIEEMPLYAGGGVRLDPETGEREEG